MPLKEMNQILSSSLFHESERLAKYVLKKVLGIKQKKDKVGEKLYEVCMEMKTDNGIFFSNVCGQLDLNCDNDSSLTIMLQIFVDGCNFGRVVALYTFFITICEYCHQNNLNEKIDILAKNTAIAICTKSNWFEQNNSWDGFVEHFTTPEEKLWKGFVMTTFGLGAVASMLYVTS